jgi:hypothetical protein
MQNIIPPRGHLWLLSVNAAATMAVATLFGGCATPPEHSYNDDFGEQLPVQPMYSIRDENDQHFILTVHQGRPANESERVINLKEAADVIAKAESQRLGWKKWQLNYIQERNQGWMHVVVAEVKYEPYVAPTFPDAGQPK